MHIDHLLAEAQHLARPCTLLVPHAVAAPIAALWGGPGIVRPMEDSHRHRITIDCRFLPPDMHDLTGCLSLYATADDPIRYDPTTPPPFRHHRTQASSCIHNGQRPYHPLKPCFVWARPLSRSGCWLITGSVIGNTRTPFPIVRSPMRTIGSIKRRTPSIREQRLRCLGDGIFHGQMAIGMICYTSSYCSGHSKMPSRGSKSGARTRTIFT